MKILIIKIPIKVITGEQSSTESSASEEAFHAGTTTRYYICISIYLSIYLSNISLHIYIYIYIYKHSALCRKPEGLDRDVADRKTSFSTWIYLYIYIERERDIVYMHIYIYIHTYTQLYEYMCILCTTCTVCIICRCAFAFQHAYYQH